MTPTQILDEYPELTNGAKTFTVRRGFTGLLWTDVARTLSPTARSFLRREFVPIALATFTGTSAKMWTDWLSDEALDDLSGLVVVLDFNGKPAAWVASNQREFAGHTCFYANSAGVHPDYQGSGLSSRIWRELLRTAVIASAPRRMYAVMRTANPLVYSAWSAGAGGLDKAYPSPVTPRIPRKIAAIASDAATYLGQRERFDPDTLIIDNAYDHTENGLWTERPSSDQQVVADWMNATLGPKDAIVLVVEFDPLSLLASELLRTVRNKMGIGSAGTSRSSRQTAG